MKSEELAEPYLGTSSANNPQEAANVAFQGKNDLQSLEENEKPVELSQTLNNADQYTFLAPVVPRAFESV